MLCKTNCIELIGGFVTVKKSVKVNHTTFIRSYISIEECSSCFFFPSSLVCSSYGHFVNCLKQNCNTFAFFGHITCFAISKNSDYLRWISKYHDRTFVHVDYCFQRTWFLDFSELCRSVSEKVYRYNDNIYSIWSIVLTTIQQKYPYSNLRAQT